MKGHMKRLLALALAATMTLSGVQLSAQAQSDPSTAVTVTTEKDVYVQGGADSGKVMGGAQMAVKTPESASLASKYHRKAVIEFDLSTAPANCNTAVVKLQVSYVGKQLTDSSMCAVYKTATGWDADTMTWNKFPARESENPIATFYKTNMDGSHAVGDFMYIDISSAVEKALKNDETSISLELQFPNPIGGDVAVSFYRHTASGKSGPSLELSYDGEKAQQKATFATLRTKWKNWLTGENLDPKDPVVADYLVSLNKSANSNWNSMVKEAARTDDTAELWSDIPVTVYAMNNQGSDAKISSGNVSGHFQRLQKIAAAYSTPGCDLYQSTEVKTELISALSYMTAKYYGSTSTNWGNWYHWEIGTPQALASTLMLLYDDLTEEELTAFMRGIERYDSTTASVGHGVCPGSPTMTGANLLDKAVVVGMAGVMTDNAQKLQHVKDAQKGIYQYVKDDDGFYEDGSFIQHHTLAYTSGYGSTLFGRIGVFFYMFTGTPWAIEYSDHSEQMVFDMIFEAIEPLLYDTQFADSTAGRGIVRPTADARNRATGIIEAILPIGEAMPAEMQQRFKSMVKYYVGVDEDYYFNHTGNITCQLMVKEIMDDPDIAPRSDYSVHKTYAGMDRVSHMRPGYGFNIAMSSSRQSKFENYSDEGLRTWNIADGMTYLYTDDLTQYTNGYWGSIDPFRLPGTTVERALNRKPFTAQAESGRTPYNWAGGVTLGTYGTAGVQMKSLGNENSGNGSGLTGADSKKSWFMFDDEIVAIGSNITSTTGNQVETIIDNRKINLDLSNKVTVNGKTPDITGKDGTAVPNANWANIEGNTANSSIGYYFPQGGTTIQALKERRDTNWNQQGPTDKEVSGSYATLWFAHGENPTDESYQYVILPGMNANQTAAYAQNPQIEVLENSGEAHAVRHNGLNMTGVNFWNDGQKTVSGITSNKKASVMVRLTDETVELSVSDPTQANTGTIEITLAVPCGDLVSKDDSITVLQTNPGLKISVDVNGSMGQSSSIVLKRDKAAGVSVVTTDELLSQKVDLGTDFSALKLPSSVTVHANDMKDYTASITWSRAGYDKDSYGVYELNGTLTLPQGVTNSQSITAKVRVQVGTISSNATQDTYVRDNSETGDQHKNENTLVVKNDASGYSRKSVVKLPLGSIPDDAERIYFVFELTGMPSVDFTDFDVYRTKADWDQSSLVWDNFPGRVGGLLVNITKADLEKSLLQKLDVTELVRQAQKDGETEISFEFSIPNYTKNNYTGIHSLESTTGQAPALLWEKTPNPPVPADKTALQELYTQNGGKDAGTYTPATWAAFDQAMKNADSLLKNSEAGQPEVNAAADTLRTTAAGLKVRANKNALQTLFNEKKDEKNKNYTPVSWLGFQLALAKAQIVLADLEAVQQQADVAVQELKDAFAGLTGKPNKSALESLYNTNKDKANDGYTVTSWNTFQRALENADAVMKNENATEAEVKAAKATLDAAIAGLSKQGEIPSENPSEKPSETPSEDPSGTPSGGGSDTPVTGEAPVAPALLLIVFGIASVAVLALLKFRREGTSTNHD